MNKDFAWGLFKNTGNVDAYLIMREVEENADKNILNQETKSILSEDKNGINKDEGNSHWNS